MARSLRIIAVTIGSALPCLLVPGIAQAKTTLRLYQKQQSMTFYNPDGTKASGNAAPVVGDYFVDTDTDYVGTAKHHAKASTASDHLVCTFTSISSNGMSGTALCNGQIAIGGSMFLAQNDKVTFAGAGPTNVVINGGTGRFAGAHGTVKSANKELTITYSL
jgi:hypothetical protein